MMEREGDTTIYIYTIIVPIVFLQIDNMVRKGQQKRKKKYIYFGPVGGGNVHISNTPKKKKKKERRNLRVIDGNLIGC